MKPIVSIVAQGSMAAAVAARLRDHGLEVRTCLTGRSAASSARAAAAGMKAVPVSQLLESDLLLSIVPPAAALALAQDLSSALAAAAHKPLYVDCNAVNPTTTRSIGAVIEATGATFADGGIIGLPPRADYTGPHLYVSGEYAEQVLALREFGLDVRVLDEAIGSASALKMSYGGITKGMTAVATAMILAATRAGLATALKLELAESEPVLYAMFARRLPDMLPKAYRWIDEMRQIQEFAGSDSAAAQIFAGAAQLYERISADVRHARGEAMMLEKFFTSADASDAGGGGEKR